MRTWLPASRTYWRPVATSRPLLQRKCDCGTHTSGGGECEACADKRRRMQRKGDGDAHEVPGIVHDVLAGAGQGLDDDTRGFMEGRFGRDFSDVRIHADPQAARSAKAVRAQAYTVGRDIVFGPGHYAPRTPDGQHLLAHELAHVVQQGGASAGGEIAMDDHGDAEADADRAADQVLAGSVAAPQASGGGLKRQAESAGATTDASAATATGGSAGPCVEEVVGEDIPSLLQAGAVTIVEFGAPWCGPCQQNLAGLREACDRLHANPPGVPVRFYTINIDAEGNDGAYERYVPGGIPHLYVYVGSTERAHYTTGIEPDAMQQLVDEQVSYASTSGATRGARSGALWGMIPGAVAGAVTAGVIGATVEMSGNAMMGMVLGSLAGGVAVGAGIGAGIGALAGHLGDDRNKGPKQQKRRRLQRRAEGEERRRDALAAPASSSRVVPAGDVPTSLSRGEQTALGAGIGAGAGAGTGALIGWGAARADGSDNSGMWAGIGALIGLGAGGLLGTLLGALIRRSTPETPAETEVLIRRRYGRYIGAEVPGALRNAVVHLVPRAELCERQNCRRNTPDAPCPEGALGWTDTGPPVKPAGREYPARLSPDQEPTCNGRSMEHATPERPVIYYTGAPGTLIHEALHGYSHQDFQFLHNHVVEGVTEHFAQQVMADVNIPAEENVYPRELADARRLIDDVGEDVVARAYFGGAMDGLHGAFNARHGRCAFIAWAYLLQMGSEQQAAAVLASGPQANHCEVWLGDTNAAEMTPGEASFRPLQPAAASGADAPQAPAPAHAPQEERHE